MCGVLPQLSALVESTDTQCRSECYSEPMKSLQRWLASSLCLSVACALTAQEPTFRTQSRLVVVPTTVADAKTVERIWNLQPEEFKLLDNGVERKITVEPWGTYESRVSLVVVVETSFLSDPALVKIKRMASSLSNITGEDGEVAVITADSEVRSQLDFTRQWEPLQEAFEKLHASNDKAGHVLDGLSAGVVLLAHRPQSHRRVILLLCEGHDRGSHVQPMEVLTHAEQENVIIYTANYSPFMTPFTVKGGELPAVPRFATINAAPVFEEIARSFKMNIGRTLAVYTGGRELSFASEERLQDDLQNISTEIHSQYQISFVPPDEKHPVYHEIEIELKNHPEAAVRARPGYWTGIPVIAAQPTP